MSQFDDTARGNASIRLRANLRDLGGMSTTDGRVVAPHRLFRCGQLAGLDADHLEQISELKIHTLIDLRSAHERAASPEIELYGVEHLWLDMIGADSDIGPARLGEILRDPVRASRDLGEGRAAEIFKNAYRDFVTSPTARTALAAVIHAVADAGPVLFHCAAGKDRTGWAAASILDALGVDRADAMTDYLATNEAMQARYSSASDTWAQAGGNQEVLDAALSARREYLEAAYAQMDGVYGGVAEYLHTGLGFDTNIIDRLRARLLS